MHLFPAERHYFPAAIGKAGDRNAGNQRQHNLMADRVDIFIDQNAQSGACCKNREAEQGVDVPEDRQQRSFCLLFDLLMRIICQQSLLV